MAVDDKGPWMDDEVPLVVVCSGCGRVDTKCHECGNCQTCGYHIEDGEEASPEELDLAILAKRVDRLLECIEGISAALERYNSEK